MVLLAFTPSHRSLSRVLAKKEPSQPTSVPAARGGEAHLLMLTAARGSQLPPAIPGRGGGGGSRPDSPCPVVHDSCYAQFLALTNAFAGAVLRALFFLLQSASRSMCMRLAWLLGVTRLLLVSRAGVPKVGNSSGSCTWGQNMVSWG